jgi:LCP family protein required for cell wall assembly
MTLMSTPMRVLLAVVLCVLISLPGGGESADRDQRSVPVIELHRVSSAAYFDPIRVNPLFVVVIGSDVRVGDPRGGRADSIHVVAVNTRTGAGTIVGIPRDSYVSVAGGPPDKINAALVRAGPQGLVATVSRMSGIRFHYWALTEFSHFQRLVEELGGLVVNVPYPMRDLQFSGANFGAGRQHMNGARVLAFARNRKATPNGDFSRSENQGRILGAALAKFRTDAITPLRLAKYFSVFRSQVLSDVPATELLRLAIIAHRIDPKRLRNLVLPGSAGSAGGASVVRLAPGAADILRRIRDDAML